MGRSLKSLLLIKNDHIFLSVLTSISIFFFKFIHSDTEYGGMLFGTYHFILIYTSYQENESKLYKIHLDYSVWRNLDCKHNDLRFWNEYRFTQKEVKKLFFTFKNNFYIHGGEQLWQYAKKTFKLHHQNEYKTKCLLLCKLKSLILSVNR